MYLTLIAIYVLILTSDYYGRMVKYFRGNSFKSWYKYFKTLLRMENDNLEIVECFKCL